MSARCVNYRSGLGLAWQGGPESLALLLDDVEKDLRYRGPAAHGRRHRFPAGEDGVDAVGWPKLFAEWRTRQQPFHWFVEFYGIMRDGGFSVVIGNPPYVSTSGIKYLPAKPGDLTAWAAQSG